MPYLSIITNLPLSEKTEAAWTAEASKALASELGKPEGYVMVALQKAGAMRFGGSESPSVFMDVRSIGLPRDCNEVTRALTEIAVRHGADAQRVYVACTDVPAARWAQGGSTFA